MKINDMIQMVRAATNEPVEPNTPAERYLAKKAAEYISAEIEKMARMSDDELMALLRENEQFKKKEADK